jgi:5,10-methylenetetrahydromethanopterin reductase
MPSHTVSIAFQTNKPLTAYGSLASTAEHYGFHGVSVYNDLLFQPAWLPLMEIARHTRRVRIGPAAVNPFTCHPVNLAGNISLIDEASQGRTYLGLARGGWLDALGIEPRRPLTALREAFECIGHLLSGSSEPYQAQIYPLAGGDALRWQVYRSEIPFLLGTWGPKTVKVCIEHISEVKIGGSANPGLVPQMRATIASAAAGVKREAHEIGLVMGAVTVVDQDGPAARAAARREVALYLSIIADLDPTLNLDPELKARLKSAAGAYDFQQVASYVNDDMLRRLAFAGTPTEVAEQAATLFEAGTQRVEFGTPHGLTATEGIRLLGEHVLPALQGRYIE